MSRIHHRQFSELHVHVARKMLNTVFVFEAILLNCGNMFLLAELLSSVLAQASKLDYYDLRIELNLYIFSSDFGPLFNIKLSVSPKADSYKLPKRSTIIFL